MRIKVKSAFFDNFMTFGVLMNTIIMCFNSYNMDEELNVLLDQFNTVFTWLFIYEMGSKLIAIGISKYCADKMNYLDGMVVMISIFEMVATAQSQTSAPTSEDGDKDGMEAAGDGGGGADLSAFKTVRMLRTFRVFRIARLLRALESMQTIMQVMVKSYKSFIYITGLMFLFIFIFSLLGMNFFRGKFDFEDGLPRGNYEGIAAAFITVF